MGVGASYIIGPYMVPFDDAKYGEVNGQNVPKDPADVEQTKQDIQNYMIMFFALAAALMILIVIYFPSKPPLPPAASSSVPRTDFTKGWKEIVVNKNVWLACLVYSIPGGVQVGWQGLMGLNFEHLGVTDNEIGQIGFVSVFVQSAAAALVAYMQDSFRDKIKITVFVLLTFSSACFIWLAFISFSIIPYSLAQLYVATIVGIATFYACVPLLFELSVMSAYPTPEGLVGAFLTGVYNLVAASFFLVMLIPNIGASWMNYVLVVATVAGLPLIYMVKKPKDFVETEKDKKMSI